MIGTSPLEYVWVVTWVIILHSIAPLCTVYCIIAVFLPASWHLWTLLEYWAYTEMTFYVLTYGYRSYYLQRPASHPPPLMKEEREKLFHLCFDSATDLSANLSKWFMDAPLNTIGRDNIKQWLRWAFLNSDTEDPLLDDEIDLYVKQLEMRLEMSFPPGRADVKSIRLTLDKVAALHRSITWYTCIFVVDVVTHIYLHFIGFSFYRGSIMHTASILPPRPQAIVSVCRSTSNDMSYWYHRHTSQKELPILFIHGIGVGLYPYMQFLKEMNQGRTVEDGQIGILAIEILAISSRITTPVLQKEDMCRQLRFILRHHGYDKFVLVSHSYGSVISTYLLKTEDLARRVSSIILVDPISILLHQPDVVYNFTVRRPKFANEWLLWYFGSKDIGVAHTLSRAFFWSQNILWKEDLLKYDATVFLCEKDSVISAPKVRMYLEDANGEDILNDSDQNPTRDAEENKHPERGHDDLRVVWCPNLDHGGAFDVPNWRGRLKVEVLQKVLYRA